MVLPGLTTNKAGVLLARYWAASSSHGGLPGTVISSLR